MPVDLAALIPGPGTLAVAVLAFLAGATVPTYYAQERFRGFGRAMVDKLPYVPPPGMDEQQALEAAQQAAEDAEDETETE